MKAMLSLIIVFLCPVNQKEYFGQSMFLLLVPLAKMCLDRALPKRMSMLFLCGKVIEY
jgi:hypothetical protein